MALFERRRAVMENVTPNLPIIADRLASAPNSDNIASSKRLELLARWIPVCQEIADECALDLPDPDRLRLMILSAHEAMCLLARVSLVFPDPITTDRIVNQFLIDCFASA